MGCAGCHCAWPPGDLEGILSTPVCQLPSFSSSPHLSFTILSTKKPLRRFSLAGWGIPFWDCLLTVCWSSPSAIFGEWGVFLQGTSCNHRVAGVCSWLSRMRESHREVPLLAGDKEPVLLLHWRKYPGVSSALMWGEGELSVPTSTSLVRGVQGAKGRYSSGCDTQFLRSSVISSDFITTTTTPLPSPAAKLLGSCLSSSLEDNT